MKILDIAIKDLIRSFRSLFALVFMFGVPLLVTGMFYIMFGSMASGNEGFSLPRTAVVIANLDAGSQQFQAVNMPDGRSANSLGDVIVQVLQDDQFADLLEVSIASDAASARQAVDGQKAGVAILIPANFSASFTDPEQTSALEVYQDPTLTIGPRIVRDILSQFMDSFAAAKITVGLALQYDPQGSQISQVVQDFLASAPTEDLQAALLDTRAGQTQASSFDFLHLVVAPIMAGMLIFYAFFTGTSTAQSIIQEDEAGTLPRLFTTPTPQSVILAGKFLAVGLTVIIQVIVLLATAWLIFGIEWGALPAVAAAALGAMAAAATFGIFINSLLKNTKQGGMIFGGVLTVSGMIGMMPTFLGNMAQMPVAMQTAALFVPQGWAIRSLKLAMDHAPAEAILINLLVLLAWSAAFFLIGVWRFQKRYA